MPAKKKKNLLVDHPAWTERLNAEWDWEKNDEMGIKPDEMAAGSHKKVAWRCEKEHEWEAQIKSRTRGRGCPICAGQQVLTGFNDLATTNPDLAGEWHPTKNGALSPQEVTAGSGKKVWWLGDCGHEWEASILNRFRKGYGCPVCAGRQVLVGFNDLATTNPDLAGEWHPRKNGDLTPQEVTAGSHRRVWWLGKCGHEWQQRIGIRFVQGVGCPVCAGRQVLAGFNDLATTNLDLAGEWHPRKNGDLTPQEVTAGTQRKAWWLGECGHEWEATVANRSNGQGCPICAGKQVLVGFNDLATTNPDLAGEWHPTKNGGLTPQEVVAGSEKKVWWLGECGHEWEQRVADRSNGQGCPVCAGRQVLVGFNDLATTNPDLAGEWHPTRNGVLSPQEVTAGSGKKVWWLGECGHEWEATVANRSNGYGCPKCSTSKGEKYAASWAKSQGFVVDEQWRDDDCRDKLPLPFDLMLYSVAGTALMETALIEYDGEQHSNENSYFNKKAFLSGYGFDYIQRHDAIKTAFCMSTHRVLIRIPHTVTGEEAIGEFISEKLRENGLGWAVRRNDDGLLAVS